MKQQRNSVQTSFFNHAESFYYEEPIQHNNQLGPWTQEKYKTLDQPKKVTFDRQHVGHRKIKNNTYLKLPLIASSALKEIQYYPQTKQHWSPMGLKIKKRQQQNQSNIAIQQSFEHRNRSLALSLDLSGKRKGRNTNLEIFGIPKSHMYI